MTTASLMDEKDREKQKHDPSKHCALWSFSSGPNTLTSSTEPEPDAGNHCIINGISTAIDWLPVQASGFEIQQSPVSWL